MVSAATQDDDFNSSDIEVDAPRLDRFATAGAHSVDNILANASSLRFDTKKAVKQLQSISGAPMTRMQRARWGNAWNSFYKGVLKKRYVISSLVCSKTHISPSSPLDTVHRASPRRLKQGSLVQT